MPEGSFFCLLCDQSFFSLELLLEHNQFHVKNEPGLMHGIAEISTSCPLKKSSITAVCYTQKLDPSQSDDALGEPFNAANTVSSASNGISTSPPFHEDSTHLKRESKSPKAEDSDSDEELLQRLLNVRNEVQQSKSILHKDKWLLVCSKCSKKCLHEEHLAEHYRQHITREKIKYYQSYSSYIETQPRNRCNLCNLSFKGNDERRKHFTMFHKHTLGFCDCDKKFYRSKKLLKHARLFHEEKLVKCDVCYKGFLNTKHLKTHYRIHLGENRRDWYGKKSKYSPLSQLNFKCKVCHRSFLRMKDLKTHYKDHRGMENRGWFVDQKSHVTRIGFSLSDTLAQKTSESKLRS